MPLCQRSACVLAMASWDVLSRGEHGSCPGTSSGQLGLSLGWTRASAFVNQQIKAMPVDPKAHFFYDQQEAPVHESLPWCGRQTQGLLQACSRTRSVVESHVPSISQVEQEQPVNMFRSNTELGP